MKLTFDQNLFTQFSLDSGGLTMLGGVTHALPEPGSYRGVVYRGTDRLATFYVNADKNSAVAQANIDLSRLDPSTVIAPTPIRTTAAQVSECCGGSEDGAGHDSTFVVNPKGYVVFHVSAGTGGYNVILRKAEEDPKTSVFDSRKLSEGDIFSIAIIRPGMYSLQNTLTRAEGRITVAYPRLGETAYRPPNPVSCECTADGFQPHYLDLKPGQGVHFHFKVPSRIKIDLSKPDDGPGKRFGPATAGWRKSALSTKS